MHWCLATVSSRTSSWMAGRRAVSLGIVFQVLSDFNIVMDEDVYANVNWKLPLFCWVHGNVKGMRGFIVSSVRGFQGESYTESLKVRKREVSEDIQPYHDVGQHSQHLYSIYYVLNKWHHMQVDTIWLLLGCHLMDFLVQQSLFLCKWSPPSWDTCARSV